MKELFIFFLFSDFPHKSITKFFLFKLCKKNWKQIIFDYIDFQILVKRKISMENRSENFIY